MKESDNTAIFPDESSGRFFSSSLTIAATYDVYGTEPTITSSTASNPFSQGPFGSYTRYANIQPRPHPPPVPCSKKRLIKKSIVLGSLSVREQGTSSKNKIQYSVVTNITVTLDPTCGQCSVRGVCAKVKEQVGFEVVLLDSKCYPILSNEDTSIPDFWRSTRKIIAASQQAYEKLGGIPPEMDLCKQMEERDESEPPKKRARVKGKEKMDDELDSTHGRLDEVIKKLESIERKMSVFDDLRKAFECCICKFSCNTPTVAPCCGRVIGCSACVERWMSVESTCPLCRVNGTITQRFHLKGFEELTAFFRMVDCSSSNVQPPNSASDPLTIVDSSSDDTVFEDLPPFRNQ